jgi:hypothetical protein
MPKAWRAPTNRSDAPWAGCIPAGRLLVSDAGVIPDRSRWWTLDMVGLNDARIAITHDRSAESLLAAAPDVVVLISRASERYLPFARATWEGPLFAACLRHGLRPQARLEFSPEYWLWALARPGSPAALELAKLPAPAPR